MASLKKAWSDPVWSKVIAAGIIAVLSVPGTYVLGLWPKIGNAILIAVRFLGNTTPVWNWLIGVVSIIAIVCAVEVWLTSVHAKRKATAAPLYTTDEFLGVNWRWRYGKNGEITGLHSLCPNCGLQIFLLDASGYQAVPQVGFQCDDCGRMAGPYDGNAAQVEDKVLRLIQRRLRERGAKGTLI
jgi:hypothetical protein